MTASNRRLLISAPGKVILFGEHAVVHEKLAVAASLGLRTYLHVDENASGQCCLKLPDVQVDATWPMSRLDIALEDRDALEQLHPSEMPPTLKAQLQALADGHTNTEAQKQAVMAFLYLFVLVKDSSKLGANFGLTIHARSTLPVGAGLGSSASYATALATTLLMVFDHVPHTFVSDKKPWLETINRYAFKAEQVIHGNPSGVDNAVATFGGALSFRRGKGFSQLEGCQSLRLLLTNTKVPRSTSALVAGVGAKKQKYPNVIDPMLDAIDGISLECVQLFKRLQAAEIDTNALVTELEDLVDMNHCLLHGLGVSHASLETVRSVTAAHGVKTKLTGAGGGGCAVSILRDDISPEILGAVTKQLQTSGYDCYQTSLGGVGASASVLSDAQDETWMASADRQTLEQLVV